MKKMKLIIKLFLKFKKKNENKNKKYHYILYINYIYYIFKEYIHLLQHNLKYNLIKFNLKEKFFILVFI